ncbi:MAG: hypothetical protein PHR87_03630 [Sulfurospirillaceae bacterium]|nr:hypothetical protein [Sulfurospirillaceae bacterium]
MKPETAEQTYQFFEEAQIVLSTLEDHIAAFNRASKVFEKTMSDFTKVEKSIDEIGVKIAEKIQVKTIQAYLLGSVAELESVTKDLKKHKHKERSTLKIVFASTCLSTLLTSITFIAFEVANKPLLNLIYQLVH